MTISQKGSELGHMGSKNGQQASSKENLHWLQSEEDYVNDIGAVFCTDSLWLLVSMYILGVKHFPPFKLSGYHTSDICIAFIKQEIQKQVYKVFSRFILSPLDTTNIISSYCNQ